VSTSLDAYLGMHPAALRLREQRTELLARNLANADTPGFKAQDMDFRSALAAATSPSAVPGVLQATRSGHFGVQGANGHGSVNQGSVNQGAEAVMSGSTESFLRYRTPLAPSLDGNTVDAQLEQAAFADNAVRYQATLSFLSSKFRSLMTAITGQ
jgi:flagellar basal-body rod protein FlgB